MLCGPGSGRVAQLGERLVRNEEVAGSIPVSSTKIPYKTPFFRCCNKCFRWLLSQVYRRFTACLAFLRDLLFQKSMLGRRSLRPPGTIPAREPPRNFGQMRLPYRHYGQGQKQSAPFFACCGFSQSNVGNKNLPLSFSWLWLYSSNRRPKKSHCNSFLLVPELRSEGETHERQF